MLALRDQENRVHSQQTVAASKPLNQGVKALQPKTPFKVPLNDENHPLTFGKKTIKGTGQHKENAKPSAKNAFATPLPDARQRAPLGMKTTNAKARGLQTPAAPAGTVKPEKTGKRASTQRVKKFAPLVEQSQPEVEEQSAHDDVPDIEYMPPKPKDLPDVPDDITYDTTFPQFKPQNLALGLETVYGNNEVGKDGLTRRERKFQEDSNAMDKMIDEMILKQVESIGFEESQQDDKSRKSPEEEAPRHHMQTRRMKNIESQHRSPNSSNVSTTGARDAAAALSGTGRSTPRNRPEAMPKPKPRVTSSAFSSKKPRAPANPSSMRPTAASANSRTTVGYSKGRDVSSKLLGSPKPATEQAVPHGIGIFSPETYQEPYATPPLDTELNNHFLGLGPDDTFTTAAEELPIYEEDEETRNFQLTL